MRRNGTPAFTSFIPFAQFTSPDTRMLKPSSLHVAAIAVIATMGAALFFAYRADRRDRAQLSADLASAKQSLTAAAARQRARDAQLQQALAAIAAQKRKVSTPVQILRDLPHELPLPQPLPLQASSPLDPAVVGARDTRAHLARPPSHSVAQGCDLCSPERLDSAASAQNGQPHDSLSPGVELPATDLKPLYDFALDCQACQAKLVAAQADLADEKAKSSTLAKERDEAVRVAKGGSALARVARAAKWFLIGAAAGAIVSHGRL